MKKEAAYIEDVNTVHALYLSLDDWSSWVYLGRIVLLFILLCYLILFLIYEYSLLRELKKTYKQNYGREYRNEPSQIKNLASTQRGQPLTRDF